MSAAINMAEAKTELSALIEMLESKNEDIIYILKNGERVAQLTLVPQKKSKRIGAALGKITLPDNFDKDFEALDDEISELFENGEAL